MGIPGWDGLLGVHRRADVPSVRAYTFFASPPALTGPQAGVRHAEGQRHGALAARHDGAVRHPDGHRRVLFWGLPVCALDVRGCLTGITGTQLTAFAWTG